MRDTAKTKVDQWLRDHEGQEFCDDCLGTRTHLGGRRPVWRATKLLAAESGYHREKKTCPICGSNRMVIKFA
jgi:hypothetical protein